MKIDEHYIECCLPKDIDVKFLNWIMERRAENLFRMIWPKVKVGNHLMERGIRFIPVAPVMVDEQLYFVDFLIPEAKVAIEMNKSVFLTDDQKSIYAEKDAALASLGFTVMRVGYDGLTKELMNDLFGPMNGKPRRWKSRAVIITHDSSTGEEGVLKEMWEEKEDYEANPRPKRKFRVKTDKKALPS